MRHFVPLASLTGATGRAPGLSRECRHIVQWARFARV